MQTRFILWGCCFYAWRCKSQSWIFFLLKWHNKNLDKAYVRSSIKGIVLNRAVEVGQTCSFYECSKTFHTC